MPRLGDHQGSRRVRGRPGRIERRRYEDRGRHDRDDADDRRGTQRGQAKDEPAVMRISRGGCEKRRVKRNRGEAPLPRHTSMRVVPRDSGLFQNQRFASFRCGSVLPPSLPSLASVGSLGFETQRRKFRNPPLTHVCISPWWVPPRHRSRSPGCSYSSDAA